MSGCRPAPLYRRSADGFEAHALKISRVIHMPGPERGADLHFDDTAYGAQYVNQFWLFLFDPKPGGYFLFGSENGGLVVRSIMNIPSNSAHIPAQEFEADWSALPDPGGAPGL